MSAKYHINPRFRAFGKARLDITLRAKDEQEWQSMWREPLNPFPFNFGSGWKFCFEYKVDDFAAEVGFFIDVLGFSVRAFSPRYAQFSSPREELCISVRETGDGEQSTDPDSLRLHLQLRDGEDTITELDRRGIVFEKSMAIEQDGESTLIGFFRSPHGLRFDLWSQNPALYAAAAEIDDGEMDDDDEAADTDDLFDIDSLEEDDADRLIDELLGLSPDENELDEDLDETDIEEDDEQVDLEDEFEHDDNTIEDHPNQKQQQTKLFASNNNIKPHNTTSYKKNEPSRLPASISRSRNVSWPTDNDRRNGEISYEELEDEV
jgi:hypothetical protein